MKAVDIDTMSWEGLAADCTKWRSALKQHLKTGEDETDGCSSGQTSTQKGGHVINTIQVTCATHVRNRVCPRVELILKNHSYIANYISRIY